MDSTALHQRIREIVRDALMHFPARSDYKDEEHDLQPHIKQVLEAALGEIGEKRLEAVTSIGGSGKPSVGVLGTSFWPDIEVCDGEEPVVGIEVKIIKDRGGRRADKAPVLTDLVGRLLIYSLRYRYVFGFVLYWADRLHAKHRLDRQLKEKLYQLGLEIVTIDKTGTSYDWVTQ